MAGIPLTVALYDIRDEHLPMMKRVSAEAAWRCGELSLAAHTPLERELIGLWLQTLEAHGAVLDLLDGLVAAVDL